MISVAISEGAVGFFLFKKKPPKATSQQNMTTLSEVITPLTENKIMQKLRIFF